MSAQPEQIERDLKRFLSDAYPDIQVHVEPWDHDPSRLALYFIEEKFSFLYPQQRFHYLSHLIPSDYQGAHLQNTVWFELAPGEAPEDLRYPDEELIGSIAPDVMKCVSASGFFCALDDLLCPEAPEAGRVLCWGDYRNSRPLLLKRGFTEDELFDVFHVLISLGGYCDCEILYNAVESRLKSEYWKARAEGRDPVDPHTGPWPA